MLLKPSYGPSVTSLCALLCLEVVFCRARKNRKYLPQLPKEDLPAWAPHSSCKAAWLLPMLLKNWDL